MAKKYTKEETEKTIKGYFDNPFQYLYACDFIRWNGTENDIESGRSYADIFAEYIIKNLSNKNIPVRFRENYKVSTHIPEKIKLNLKSPRREEQIARALFKKEYDIPEIGKVFDYQIPLSQKDEGVGKIDLVAKDEAKKVINLIELKTDSEHLSESLLRPVLEIFTYSKQLKEKQFRKEFDLDDNYTFKKVVMLFEGTTPANMALELESNKHPNLKKFIVTNDIDIFIFNKVGDDLENINLKLYQSIHSNKLK